MKKITCAVIMAAGMGDRLSGMLEDKPKGFIKLSGMPIIERSVRQLRAAGIHDIVIVTGYGAGYYESLGRQYPEIRLIHNEHYAESGSMFSLYCARAHIRDTFLLLESDLVYETRALEELLAVSKPNAILMSGFTRSDDEVFISTRDERVVKLSKRREELDNIFGELVGISRISPDMFDAMVRFAESHFTHDLHLHYEDCINGITSQIPVFHHKIEDLTWAEIDTPEHLRRVQDVILPRLDGAWNMEGKKQMAPSSFELTPQQLDAFAQDGFIALPGLFDSTEIDDIGRTIDMLASQPPAQCVGKQMMYFEDSVIPGEGKVLSRIEKFVEYSAVLKQVVEDKRLIYPLRQILNEDPLLFKEKINFKMPGGQGFEPHQDIQPGWDDYADYFVSALITVDPSTAENGCLELAAGHHKQGLIGEKWKPLAGEQLYGVEFVQYPTEPGDVLLFDCFVPHQSPPNRTDMARRNLYLTYNRKSRGDHRLRYYADKRKSFPPDYERDRGKEYRFKV